MKGLTNMSDNAAHALQELLHGHLFLLQPAEHLSAAGLTFPLLSSPLSSFPLLSSPLTQSSRQPLPAGQAPLKEKKAADPRGVNPSRGYRD